MLYFLSLFSFSYNHPCYYNCFTLREAHMGLASNTETTSADKGPLSVSIFESVCESVRWSEVCKCDVISPYLRAILAKFIPLFLCTWFCSMLKIQQEAHIQHILLQFGVFVNGTKCSVRKNIEGLIRSWKIQELSGARTRYFILMVRNSKTAENVLTLRSSKCRVFSFFIWTHLEKFSVTSLAHQWMLCSEWVPSESVSKQLIKNITVKIIAHWVQNVCVRFSVFSYSSSLLSKCMLRIRKRRISKPSQLFHDRRKFRRHCVNTIDTTTWGRIYLLA